ncbi:MAG: hypothetical protein NC393_08960 [Clostridium sp.]|nr:hypothetical protein [Clostridium sp.]
MNNRKKKYVILLSLVLCLSVVFIVGKLRHQDTASTEEVDSNGMGTDEADTGEMVNTSAEEASEKAEGKVVRGRPNWEYMLKVQTDLVAAKGNVLESNDFIDIGGYAFKFGEADFYREAENVPCEILADDAAYHGYFVVIPIDVKNCLDEQMEYLPAELQIVICDGEQKKYIADIMCIANENEFEIQEGMQLTIDAGETITILAVYGISKESIENMKIEDISNPQLYVSFYKEGAVGYGGNNDITKDTDNIFFKCNVTSWEG